MKSDKYGLFGKHRHLSEPDCVMVTCLVLDFFVVTYRFQNLIGLAKGKSVMGLRSILEGGHVEATWRLDRKILKLCKYHVQDRPK